MLYTNDQKDIVETLFPGNAEYHVLLQSIDEFVEAEILPAAGKIDREGLFPRKNLEKAAAKGIFALPFPGKYNGRGMPFPVYAAALELIAKACANTSLQISIQGMVCEGIRLFGNDAQKNIFLKEMGLVEGRRLIAFALTEPCCGSDAKSIRTRAVRSGDRFVLNGSKTLISNPGEADFSMVFAVTENGISPFLVPADTPGFKVMKVIPKLGFRGNQLSAIQLDNCAVPAENLLGEEGKGLEYLKHILNSGRITIAAIAVGIAQAAFEKSLSYSGKRKTFGQPISHYQLLQGKLADMATEISAARLLTYYAASQKHAGRDIASAASKAKLFSSEAAIRVCDNALQIHGGYGYTDVCDVHRHLRDARLLTIAEGTSEMLRLFIAHLSLKEEA